MTLAPGELGAYRPALRPGLLLGPARLRGPATVHRIKDPGSGSSFEIGVKECFLLARMDGLRSLDDLGEEYGRQFGRRLGEQNWQQLLGLLGSRGLLAGAPGGAPESPAPAGLPVHRPRLEGTPLKGTWRLVSDAQASSGRLYRALRPVLRPAVQLPLLALVVAMELLLGLHLGELGRGAWWLAQRPALLLGALVLLWLSITLHELAHAVAAQAYGTGVAEIGLHWRVPMAFMYCTVEDYPYLRSRVQQVVISGAGALMNLVFLLPFCVWWAALPPGGDTRRALSGLLLLGSAQALVNLVPLPPLDGYAMLSNALGLAGYATETRRYLGLRLSRGPEARTRLAAYSRRAHLVYGLYGLATALLCAAVAAALLLTAGRLILH
ncbi:peptidase M50 [Streptacidiphilus sp. N1-3]|uniref:Peptidase M50 n=1 Tax=Streptacidiphilus alkalitolerans TaxID=3342712 RepID=A0ABV6X930_9ACTN